MKLGNQDYPTKAAVMQHARGILYQRKAVLPGSDDFDFLFALLQAHLRREKKIGAGVAFFFVGQMGCFNAPNFNIRRVDGTSVDFSFYKCIDALGREVGEVVEVEHRKHLNSAYRAAVWPDIQSFRKGQVERRCAICNEAIVGVAHVDHSEPTFFELVRLFESQCGKPAPVAFEDCGALAYHPHGKKFCSKDAEYEQVWREFHKKNAVLRLTCAACNLKRPR